MIDIGLGQVVEFAINEPSELDNIRTPKIIDGITLVPNTTDFDLYRKTDVPSTLQPTSPYLSFCIASEYVPLGGVDASSPFVASIGQGAAKVNVYSLFANSEDGAPTLRASTDGVSVVNMNPENQMTYSTGIGWSVVSNGQKFFAYPLTPIQLPTKTCRTSTDGITWISEELSGDYPNTFSESSQIRFFYNYKSNKSGIVPANVVSSDFFSVGENIFLIDRDNIYRSSDGLNWTNITESVFGTTPSVYNGNLFFVSGTQAAIVSAYGIKYTTDSGGSWSQSVGGPTLPTTYSYLINKTNTAKIITKNTSPNSKYFVSSNTGKNWNEVFPEINQDIVLYKGTGIVIAQSGGHSIRVSTDDGASFVTPTISGFLFPVKTGVCSQNYFYLRDNKKQLFKSSNGSTWVLVGKHNIPDECFGHAISPNSTTDIIFSNDSTGQYPYMIIYNDGLNVSMGRLGESGQSVILPLIDGDESGFVCNSINKFGMPVTLTDLESPPYMKFSLTKIEPSRIGMYPYIRIA